MTLNGAFFDVLHKYLLCQPLTVEARGGVFFLTTEYKKEKNADKQNELSLRTLYH